LTGGVEVKVGWGEKIHEIREILDHFGVSLSETAYVGDGKNDMTIFSHVGLSIAFRPESEEVAEAAMITIKGNDLRHILEHIV
jgi:phosphoserine phosphatase